MLFIIQLHISGLCVENTILEPVGLHQEIMECGSHIIKIQGLPTAIRLCASKHLAISLSLDMELNSV